MAMIAAPMAASIAALRPSCRRASCAAVTSGFSTSLGVSRNRLKAATPTMAKKSAILIRSRWPYLVSVSASMLPERYQVLMMPVSRIVATLTMPSVEKRSVAVRATASVFASCPVMASSSASGASAPTQAAAAIRCKMSATG